MTRLALDEVTFWYPATRAPALREVSLGVAAGEIVALVGKVGAGASTLLLVAADLAPRVTGGRLAGAVRRGARIAGLEQIRDAPGGGEAFATARAWIEDHYDRITAECRKPPWERSTVDLDLGDSPASRILTFQRGVIMARASLAGSRFVSARLATSGRS